MNVSLNADVQSMMAELSQKNASKAYETAGVQNDNSNAFESHHIHNAAVNVSISMESMRVFINIKSIEVSQNNTTAQTALNNIINGTGWGDFFAGKQMDNGFSLSSIGYEGKPLTELLPNEAKALIADDGFFGVEQTSNRVSAFAFGLAGDDLEALQESRKGLVQGFEEAEKLWGGQLPEISYQTQEQTLKIIDEKIAELLKTDSQKEAEKQEL